MSGRWDDSCGYGPSRHGIEPIKADSKIMSGWCMNGSHEGRRKGNLPECKYPHHCACDCHVTEQQLRVMMKQPEPMYAAPGAPIPVRMGIVTDISGAVLSAAAGDVVQTQRIEGVASHSSSLKTRLEWRVYEICKKYVAVGAHEADLMTVSFLQQQLDDNTSSGAIDAVLKRWTEQGFATMEKKPTRFKGFTERGTLLGLEEFLRQYRKLTRTR